MKKMNSKKGFTLMEMLIVVAIIAVLVAIAIPSFSGALTKSKESADVANLRALYAEWETSILTENTNVPSTSEAFLAGPGATSGASASITLNYTAGTGTGASTSTSTHGYSYSNGTITYTPTKINDSTAYTWTLKSANIS